VPSIEETIKEIILRPVRFPFLELVNAHSFKQLLQERKFETGDNTAPEILSEVEEKYSYLLRKVELLIRPDASDAAIEAISKGVRRELQTVLELPALKTGKESTVSSAYKAAIQMALAGTALAHKDSAFAWGTVLGWTFIHNLGRVAGEKGAAEQSRSWIDEWLLGKIIVATLQGLGLDEGGSWHAVLLIKILTSHQNWCESDENSRRAAYQILQKWLQDGDVQRYLQVNRYQGVLWYNKESYEKLLSWMLAIAVVEALSEAAPGIEEKQTRITFCYEIIKQLQGAQEISEYQVEKLLEAVKG
jgi:hypothetical protein